MCWRCCKQKRALKDKPVERVVFNAITKQSVLEAMAIRAQIDEPLVDAYLARRALDYLVGFTLSPVLWRKLPGARSAGRVQSVALRLVCDRENEIETLHAARNTGRSRPRWSTPRGERFEARLVGFDGKKLAAASTSPTRRQARRHRSGARRRDLHASPRSRRSRPSAIPPPPFTTSTLQQEASRKLGFSASAHHAGRAAPLRGRRHRRRDRRPHHLYAHRRRADGARRRSPRARQRIGTSSASATCRTKPRLYSDQGQERAGSARGDPPDRLRRARRRSVAQLPRCRPGAALRADLEARHRQPDGSRPRSSAPPSRSSRSTARAPAALRAAGSGRPLRRLPRRSTTTGRDDDAEDEESRRLPEMPRRRTARPSDGIAADQHFTEPPPRYSEATLIKKMEELGIGRPSTYASILTMLRDRDYVRLDKRRLVPEDKGRLVTAFLESFFERYVEYDFTAASRRSSTRSPPASSPGRTCCAISGRTSPATSTRSRNCASPTCSTR